MSDVQKLTPRQKEILRLILSGFDAKSAARELGISVHTVNEHLGEARRHLAVSSSREAARILKQAESTPPINEGPDSLGVLYPASRRFLLGKPSLSRWLARAGVLLVIFVAAALSYSIATGSMAPKNARIPPKTISTHATGPEWNPTPYKSRDVAIGSFDRMKVSGPFEVSVIVRPGPAHVQLLGPPALLADTIAALEGDTLVIRFREGAAWSWNPGSGVNVSVSAPNLNVVNVEGAAQVEIYGVRGDSFSAATDDSGSITARGLNVGHIQLATGGSGGITAEGRAREGTYVVGGPGDIDAMRLRTMNASIAIGGAGSAYADVSNAANISVNGNGSVEVLGGASCIKQPANSPRIECR